MERPVRALAVGVGAMGSLCARFMLQKGVEIVGAVTRATHLGEDLGDACGLGRPVGLTVGDDLARALRETKPDVAVVCVGTFVEDIYELLSGCLDAGVNVITTSEELLYSWRTQPVLTADLDERARRAGATRTPPKTAIPVPRAGAGGAA